MCIRDREFTNDFINSVREESIEEFQRRYREVDVLLIDDIQFIQGKERTVEEFFHTFNSLYNAGKQIVLTSDVPPRELDLEDRIRSRFAAVSYTHLRRLWLVPRGLIPPGGLPFPSCFSVSLVHTMS